MYIEETRENLGVPIDFWAGLKAMALVKSYGKRKASPIVPTKQWNTIPGRNFQNPNCNVWK